jgi:hypothetical protein
MGPAALVSRVAKLGQHGVRHGLQSPFLTHRCLVHVRNFSIIADRTFNSGGWVGRHGRGHVEGPC